MGKFWAADANGNPAFYDEAVHGPRMVDAPQSAEDAAKGKRVKKVANPACAIPADAKPISDEEHARLIALQNGTHELRVEAGAIVAHDLASDPARILAANTRERNRLLAESDWTQLPDSPLSPEQRSEWAAYRQQLRDMDLHAGAFPSAPGEA